MKKSVTSKFENDYTKIKVHPLFVPIKQFYEFFILGIAFIGTPDFQRTLLMMHPGFEPILSDYNKRTNLTVKNGVVQSNNRLYLTSVGRLMAISIFDFLQFSPYHKKLSQSEVFRFAKHIRNGAAHNNVFYITNVEELKQKPAKWRDMEITPELNGTPVVPEYINPNLLLYLMADISLEIEQKVKI